MELRFINKTGNRHFDKPANGQCIILANIHEFYLFDDIFSFCNPSLSNCIGETKNWAMWPGGADLLHHAMYYTLIWFAYSCCVYNYIYGYIYIYLYIYI